ncbi:UDP-N-acetylglucosamine 2-epimerase (non-hydrolyzing) [Vagococcus carniphilus]|uniref:non-hydrolyzing UDP-N-acetylglucosamine 2-epimerase n=1 Tax=Vagococcus carniphilus TaxID=218144 RepID=UPI00289062DB|nr:UDP-N-acetylglucosamine 2-epimerase (non-hydrolyzing) [Vagococcus carniphilus]MDT2830952.1 UDP-N-acetylglucosamine 2-epimerase (non-hydrolyzing) [Vagococcus carniphilus]MDT2838151.1 UDP-N-acetylglucosamine 2-epimerase (non-hydrolyzing) [Vagococcus carniphilus]MDT2853688.1 UDP-N-acetylglucosamine 2-epimerase (non-hydrolyzing) [Vagococcus carniphilus]
MKKIKVMSVFGTRPEAIKMAPLVLELEKQGEIFESIVVVTAQHREMLDQVLDIFNITPDFDLDIMKPNQTLADITSNALQKLDPIIKEVMPDVVLVHGDTTTAYVASLAAFYNQVKVGHVEAGLRTWNIYSPFPEEANRQMIDILTDFYFAPTLTSSLNLLKEQKSEKEIFVTGNTVIDALKETVKADYTHPVLDKISDDEKFILMTMHRRENLGKPMEEVFSAARETIEKNEDLHLIYPVHLNPKVKEIADRILGNHSRIHLIEPLDVIDFHNFASRSYFIMSDSGGVQEEAPSFNVPVLVLRDTTERPEGVEAGTLKLIGTEYGTVKREIETLLNDSKLYEEMSQAKNPYGDGLASKRIAYQIANYFDREAEKVSEFI